MAKQPKKGHEATENKDQDDGVSESSGPDAPLIDTIPPEVHAASPKVDAAPHAQDDPVDAPADPDTTPKPAVSPTPATPPAPAAGAGFLPLAIGGLLAGVIGFAVATFTAPASDDSTATQLAQQSAAIAALEDRLAATPQVDTSALEAAFAEQLAALSKSIDDINTRLDVLEARPEVVVSGDTDAGAAVAADVDALRAQLAEMADAAQTELDQARAAAAAIEENAAAAARNAAARAALARVQTALESGAPLGAALGDLEAATGESAPAALLAVSDGVPTLPALQDEFPAAARTALATARSEGVAGEDSTGLGAFLRNQFDVRSTAPRDGDDADAVLSRAEAALRSGRLADALAELSALPEVARAEMSDWLALAEARADAVAAVDILSTSLSEN